MFTRSLVRLAARSVAIKGLQTKPTTILRPWMHVRCSSMCFSTQTPPSDSPADVPGATLTKGEKFVMLYTCTVCDTRAAKTISKHAYYHGVVLIRCPTCQNLHLVADRLGWFEDGGYDIQTILAEKGENARVVTHDDILELTEADILGQAAEPTPPKN